MTDVDERIIGLLTEKLQSTLIHPGDKTKDRPAVGIPMLPFRSVGVHPGLREEFNRQAGLPPEQQAARMIAEAIIHTIQSEGAATIVDNAELARLRAGEEQLGERVVMRCRCGKVLATMRVKGSETVGLDPLLVAKTLTEHSCA